MKKNKGFTLVELLATIIILAGIALVAFPALLNTIKNSENKIDETTRKWVINAAELYIDDNLNEYPKKNGNTYCISLNDLITSKHLEKGILDAADVDSSNKSVKVSVNNDFNYSLVDKGECSTYIAEPMCKLVKDTGNVGITLGDEYECNLGNELLETFFVLEDGNNTILKKGDGTLHYQTDDIGTTNKGEVSLIMDKNIDNSSMYWCKSGFSSTDTCNGDGVIEALKNKTNSWSNTSILEINLPTYAQIKQANDGETTQLKEWLIGNLYNNPDNTSLPYGYWTSTGSTNIAWSGCWVNYGGNLGISSFNGNIYGIRPIITVSKSELQ